MDGFVIISLASHSLTRIDYGCELVHPSWITFTSVHLSRRSYVVSHSYWRHTSLLSLFISATLRVFVARISFFLCVEFDLFCGVSVALGSRL